MHQLYYARILSNFRLAGIACEDPVAALYIWDKMTKIYVVKIYQRKKKE